jgi:hypothetical protein
MSEIKNLSSIIGRKDFVALLSLIGRAFWVLRFRKDWYFVATSVF